MVSCIVFCLSLCAGHVTYAQKNFVRRSLPELIFRASHKALLFTAPSSSTLRTQLPAGTAREGARTYGTTSVRYFVGDAVMAHLTAKTTLASKTGAVLH